MAQNAEVSACICSLSNYSSDAGTPEFPVGSAGSSAAFRAFRGKGDACHAQDYVGPRDAHRIASHRGRSNGRLWLAIGISLTGLSFAHATLAAGVLPQGDTYVAGAGTIATQGNGLVITQPGSTHGVIN